MSEQQNITTFSAQEYNYIQYKTYFYRIKYYWGQRHPKLSPEIMYNISMTSLMNENFGNVFKCVFKKCIFYTKIQPNKIFRSIVYSVAKSNFLRSELNVTHIAYILFPSI